MDQWNDKKNHLYFAIPIINPRSFSVEESTNAIKSKRYVVSFGENLQPL